MTPDTIPMYLPLIEKEEIAAATESLEMGWLGMGSYVAEFEKAVAEEIGALAAGRHVAAVSTGHAALHLALLVAGVGEGDEVITPSFNNVADFQAILATGASPVFCDIDEASLTIDLAKAEELVTERTKAVIAMDYGCMLCDHDAVSEFASRHGIRVIHDAAHSFGSSYRGAKVGAFSDITMFSFDPVKNITCIDGGALVVKDEEELRQIQEMRLIGMGQPPKVMYENRRAWTYDVSRLGFRYHMPNLHAAIGLAQIKKLARFGDSRRKAADFLNRELAGIPGLTVPGGDLSAVFPFLYVVRVPAGAREEFRKFLLSRGVETGIHWQPGHWFTLFKDCRRGDLTHTEKIAGEIVSLPFHSCMPDEHLERIAGGVRGFFEHGSSDVQ